MVCPQQREREREETDKGKKLRRSIEGRGLYPTGVGLVGLVGFVGVSGVPGVSGTTGVDSGVGWGISSLQLVAKPSARSIEKRSIFFVIHK